MLVFVLDLLSAGIAKEGMRWIWVSAMDAEVPGDWFFPGS
jgi:hypothetical protein